MPAVIGARSGDRLLRLKHAFSAGLDAARARAFWLLPGALFALCWGAVHVALLPYLIDDSFIHLRVAEQLLDTGRPHFNAGDAFKTSSSTPFVLLLALLRWASPDSLVLVALACAAISLLHAALTVRLFQRLLARRLRAWEVALVLIVQLSLTQMASVVLMETALALTFAVLGLIDYLELEARSFFWLALAACVRVELALLLLVTALVAARSRRHGLARSLGWAALGAGPACAFDLAYYGTLVPHAAVAKRIIHQLRPGGSLSMLPPEALTRELHLMMVATALYLTLAVAMAVLPLFELGRPRAAPEAVRAEVLLVAALSGLGIAASYVIGRALVFAWYRPLYLMLAFLPATFWVLTAPSTRKFVALGLLSLPLTYDLANTLVASTGRPERLRHFLEGARARRTRALAAELHRKYPGEVLMASEIGAVGHGFRGKIADAAGLASDRALAFYPLLYPAERAHSADAPVPRAFLAQERPGLVLAVDRHLDAIMRHPIRADYVHQRFRLYEPADDRRRASEELLWSDVRFLDLLVRRDLWMKHRPGGMRELPGT